MRFPICLETSYFNKSSSNYNDDKLRILKYIQSNTHYFNDLINQPR